MPNYKIHIDKPLPDSSRIRKHQNFDALYRDYQAATRYQFWKNLYRKPVYFASLVMVLSVGYLVYDAAKTEAKADLAGPPFPAMALPADSLMLDPSTAFSWEGPNGLSLFLPARSLVDAGGKDISGPVSLTCRVVSQASTAYLMGLPVPLSPTALVEVQAWQNGQPLQFREAYPLTVTFKLPGEPTPQPVYAFDRASQSWASLSPTAVSPLENEPVLPAKPRLASVYDPQAGTLVAKSQAPMPQEPGRPFGVKLENGTDFPEFRRYARTFWEYVEAPGFVNPWEAGLIDSDTPWEDVKVARSQRAGAYELTFRRFSADRKLERRRVLARPLFEARSQEEADRLYRTELAAYNQGLKAWYAARDSVAAERARQEAEKARYLAALARWRADSAAAAGQAGPQLWAHRFDLPQPGTGGLLQLPPATDPNLRIDLTGPWASEDLHHLVAVDLDEQALLPLTPASGQWTAAVVPGKAYVLWAVAPDGALLGSAPRMWLGPASDQGSLSLELRELAAPGATAVQLEAALDASLQLPLP